MVEVSVVVERVVLLVDDEVLIQFMLEDALTQAGYGVLLASSAAEAEAQLTAKAPALFGLITDIRLGQGASGWEVAKRARQINPTLPIVYISGDSRADWMARGVPGSRLVSKPFIAEEVVSLLETLPAGP